MLPSQIARPTSSRSHMYRRHRSRRVPAVIAALLLIACAIAVFKWIRGGGEPSNALAAEPAVSPAVVERQTPSNSNTGAPATQIKRDHAPPAQPPIDAMRTAAAPPSPPASVSVTSPNAGSSTEQKISMGSSTLSQPPVVSPPAMKAETPKPDTLKSEPMKSSADHAKPPSSPPLNPAPASIPPPSLPPTSSSSSPATAPTAPSSQRLKAGLDLIAQNKPVEARAMLSSALQSTSIAPSDAQRIREELTKLNQRLVFGPEIIPGDPFVSAYTIEAGDSLAKLPRKLSLSVDWRFIQRINNITAPERIRVGQRLKIVKGPFHAIVRKPTFQMDLYMGSSSDRVYVRSFPVGLGEFGATPEGEFIVKLNSKLVDPAWTNPRTGEFFASGDPKNPLGKFWVGLIGISENIRDLETYGIHGTVDPESIGQLKSMGCIRMLDADIALVYEVLIENVSHVEIHGEDYP